ncbi:MAG TPA: hypothetical protein VHC00_04345 [Rhizobiaceae bacterium]|nr:hypothetical protein [Rhizobiaceae bacterium]
MSKVPLLACIVLSLAASSAAAEDSGRYALQKSPNGYVRLDRQTGEIAICQENGGELACRAAVDEKKAMQDEIDRLDGKIDRLERRVSTLEKAGAAGSTSTLPSDADLDRTMNFMERFFRRFMGIVKEFNQNPTNSDQGGQGPGRT